MLSTLDESLTKGQQCFATVGKLFLEKESQVMHAKGCNPEGEEGWFDAVIVILPTHHNFKVNCGIEQSLRRFTDL